MKKVLATLGGIALILILGYIYHINTLKEGMRFRNPFGGSSSTTTTTTTTEAPLGFSAVPDFNPNRPTRLGGATMRGDSGDAFQSALNNVRAQLPGGEDGDLDDLGDGAERIAQPKDTRKSVMDDVHGSSVDEGQLYDTVQPVSVKGQNSRRDAQTARYDTAKELSNPLGYDSDSDDDDGDDFMSGKEIDALRQNRVGQSEPAGKVGPTYENWTPDGVAPAGTDWEAEGFA